MKHRLSGIVNNCGLNGALPAILIEIQAFAMAEANGTALDVAPYYNTYDQLKTKFCEAHGLDSLSWTQFNALLAPYQSNFLLLQLLFAHPLRLFYTSILSSPSTTKRPQQREDYKTIQETSTYSGRYIPIASDRLNKFYWAFGIPLRIHETQEYAGKEVVMSFEYPLLTSSSAPVLELTCKGHHFESVFETGEEARALTEFRQNRENLSKDLPGLDFSKLGHQREATKAQLAQISHTLQMQKKGLSNTLSPEQPQRETHVILPSPPTPLPQAGEGSERVQPLPLAGEGREIVQPLSPTPPASDNLTSMPKLNASPPAPPPPRSPAIVQLLGFLEKKHKKYTSNPNMPAIASAIQTVLAFAKKENFGGKIPTPQDCDQALQTLKSHRKTTTAIGDFFKNRLDDLEQIIQWVKQLLRLTSAEEVAQKRPTDRNKSAAALTQDILKRL